MKSYTKIASIALVLAILLVSGYLFSGRSVVPPNSVKYQNKELGISLFYPQSLREITKQEPEFLRLALPTTELTSVEVPETITFLKPSTLASPNDLEKTLVSSVIFDASGEHPDSIGQFGQAEIGGQRFYFIQSGRFEGWLSYEYFLTKSDKVMQISVRWYIGDHWMDPTFEIKDDARYKQLMDILATVRIL